MEETLRDWPVALAFAALFAIALIRGTATFVVGRALRTAGERTSDGSRGRGGSSVATGQVTRAGVERAERIVRRVGPPAVSLGFLTVGLQTAINIASGALRMPWRHFVPAVLVGAALWATLYLTVGLAVVTALLGRFVWWWLLAAVVAVLLVLLVAHVGRRLGGPDRREGRDHTPS